MTNTIYYDENYNQYTERELYDKFYEWIDEVYDEVEILTVHFYPSNIIGEPDSPEFIEAFGHWLNSEQDNGTLTEAAQLDLSDPVDVWLQDNAPDDITEHHSFRTIVNAMHDLLMAGNVCVNVETFGPEVEPVDMSHTELLVQLLATLDRKK